MIDPFKSMLHFTVSPIFSEWIRAQKHDACTYTPQIPTTL